VYEELVEYPYKDNFELSKDKAVENDDEIMLSDRNDTVKHYGDSVLTEYWDGVPNLMPGPGLDSLPSANLHPKDWFIAFLNYYFWEPIPLDLSNK